MAGSGTALRYEYNSDQRPVRSTATRPCWPSTPTTASASIRVTYRGDQKRITYFLYDGHELSAEISVDAAGDYVPQRVVYVLIQRQSPLSTKRVPRRRSGGVPRGR